MFLGKYLNSTYMDLVYNSYDEKYLGLIDENNFDEIYSLLKENGFYFIDDIILNYLELFEIEKKYVKRALSEIKRVLGDDYVQQIGKNMMLIDKIIDMAINYSENDD